jgi:hypothetical protein
MKTWLDRSLRIAQPRGAARLRYQTLLGGGLQFERLEDRHMLAVTAVTSTVNVGNAIQADTPADLGANLATWDARDETSQTESLVEADGLDLFRFPGGIPADTTHFNVSSGQTVPQFAQFVQSVGGAGLITVDYGSGSPQEAAAELAYLQGSPADNTQIGVGIQWNGSAWVDVNWGTVGQWASLRTQSPLAVNDGLNFMRIDHAAPFSTIDDYEVGNEEYGSWEPDYHGTAGPGGVSTGSAHNAATYAQFSATFYSYAKEITSAAGLPMISIGLGSDDPSSSWTKTVIADELADGMTASSMFISDHSYAQSAGSENDSFLLNSTVTNPSSVLDWSTRYTDYEKDAAAAGAGTVAVIATEWNSVATDPGKQSVSLVNGLYTAESIGSLLESGYSGAAFWGLQDNGELGNNDSSSLYGWREFGDYGLFGNGYDTSSIADAQGVLFPSYFGMQLASKIDVAGGTVVSATSSNSNLDVYAVDEADGDLDLLVVNTSPTNSATDTFTIAGFTPGTSATVWQYGETQDTAQENSPTAAAALAKSTATLNVSGASFSYSFPAYSMTVLDIPAGSSVVVSGTATVTPSGATASYTAGAPAVTVDPGVSVSSSDGNLTGATVSISAATLQPGDTLAFTSPNGSGISGVYSGGVLTLSGTATVAQYQAALQSVTFASTSASTATRSISIVAIDGAVTSNPAAEQVNVVAPVTIVSAPVTIVGAYVSGSAWTHKSGNTNFDGYLSTHGLGDPQAPSLGYALQTGSAQLTDLPWANINTISVQFSGPVSNIGLGSLILLGGTGAGAAAAPAVTGFKSDGNNTYSWTLASALGNNQYLFAIATTDSSFGTPGSTRVTDANGAGISGAFTTGSSSFPSGNGLAGSTFDFFFNVLPGDGNQDGVVNLVDTAEAKALMNNREGRAGYNPYFDYDGAGLINTIDSILDTTLKNANQLGITPPRAPVDLQQAAVTASVGFTALALAVQETASAVSTGLQTGITSNVVAAGAAEVADAIDDSDDAASSGSESPSAIASNSTPALQTAQNQAIDEALSDFDPADLYV